MKTSKPLYVYLQRPDNGEWVTVGRHRLDEERGVGLFLYAPSYIRCGLAWAIDPVNLPFVPGMEWETRRYRGLHDVLRDASPDAWGRLLLQRQHNLPPDTPDVRYLQSAGNAERWGALAVGSSRAPAVAHLASPRLTKLEALSRELLALYERRPPEDATLRKRLLANASLGGARPKTTLQDDQQFWLIKPRLATDLVDIAQLEHWAHQLGSACGLNFAPTVLHQVDAGLSVLRVLRFDRHGERRHMAVSAASLLQTETPGATTEDVARWSYPRLAEELKRIGAPLQDRIELFGRMVFNAVVGNDDDHPRNHAVLYSAEEKCWRLSPAYDVVPDALDRPRALCMQLSTGRFDISREAMLADALRFGFDDAQSAATHLDALLERVRAGWDETRGLLSAELAAVMQRRLQENLELLAG